MLGITRLIFLIKTSSTQLNKIMVGKNRRTRETINPMDSSVVFIFGDKCQYLNNDVILSTATRELDRHLRTPPTNTEAPLHASYDNEPPKHPR